MPRRTFNYKLSYEKQVKMSENKSSGLFDSLFKDVTVYRARIGRNSVRILPPTWENADHYGFEISLHMNIGDNRSFLCIENNPCSPYQDDDCPICEARRALGVNISEEDKKLLRCYQRFVYYIIDREAVSEGVQVWMVSGNINSEIATYSLDTQKGSVIDIVDPDRGYDLYFMRQGKGIKDTKYRGWQVARDPSPVSDDEKLTNEWLDYIIENPIPKILKFQTRDYINKIFRGRSTDEGESVSSRHSDTKFVIRRTESRHSEEVEEEDHSDGRESRNLRGNRQRTELENDLDDEIPSDGSRSSDTKNRDSERSSRRILDEDESKEEQEERLARARSRINRRSTIDE